MQVPTKQALPVAQSASFGVCVQVAPGDVHASMVQATPSLQPFVVMVQVCVNVLQDATEQVLGGGMQPIPPGGVPHDPPAQVPSMQLALQSSPSATGAPAHLPAPSQTSSEVHWLLSLQGVLCGLLICRQPPNVELQTVSKHW